MAFHLAGKKFSKFLEEELGFDKEVATYTSNKLITSGNGSLVAQAMEDSARGNDATLQRLMETLEDDIQDIMDEYVRLKFQTLLQKDFGFDEEMAKYISDQFVTEEHSKLALRAMGGDQQAMSDLMRDIASDEVHILLKFYQLETAKMLRRHHFDKEQAHKLSEVLVTEENLELIEQYLDGDERAQHEVRQQALAELPRIALAFFGL